MSAHTPGPWIAKGSNGKYNSKKNTWSVEDQEKCSSTAAPITLKNGKVIGFAVDSSDDYFSEDPRLHANAAVMAAAPDMLATLKWLDSIGGLGIDNHKRIRAAIAKATTP